MEIALFISGYLVQLAASCMLLRKIVQQKSIYGLSHDTLMMMNASVFSRVIWSLFTRLIETRIAYLELAASTVVACALTYYSYKYRHTNIRSPPQYLKASSLIPAAALLGVFIHPGSKWMTVQILVAFSMYIEAVALLPQLYLFRRSHEVENVNSNYVGLMTVSRGIRLMFWIQLWFLGEMFTGLLLADVVHCVASLDFCRLWVSKLKNGGRLVYAASTMH